MLRNVVLGRKLSPMTLSRDIETCLRSYAPRSSGTTPEDFAEPMLGELGLLAEEKKDTFHFVEVQRLLCLMVYLLML